MDGGFADLVTLLARATSTLHHTLDSVFGAALAMRVDAAVDGGKSAGAEFFNEEVAATDKSVDQVGRGMRRVGG